VEQQQKLAAKINFSLDGVDKELGVWRCLYAASDPLGFDEGVKRWIICMIT
jgi:hypothetical protein